MKYDKSTLMRVHPLFILFLFESLDYQYFPSERLTSNGVTEKWYLLKKISKYLYKDLNIHLWNALYLGIFFTVEIQDKTTSNTYSRKYNDIEYDFISADIDTTKIIFSYDDRWGIQNFIEEYISLWAENKIRYYNKKKSEIQINEFKKNISTLFLERWNGIHYNFKNYDDTDLNEELLFIYSYINWDIESIRWRNSLVNENLLAIDFVLSENFINNIWTDSVSPKSKILLSPSTKCEDLVFEISYSQGAWIKVIHKNENKWIITFIDLGFYTKKWVISELCKFFMWFINNDYVESTPWNRKKIQRLTKNIKERININDKKLFITDSWFYRPKFKIKCKSDAYEDALDKIHLRDEYDENFH